MFHKWLSNKKTKILEITYSRSSSQFLVFTGKEIGTFNLWKILTEVNGDSPKDYDLFNMGRVCETGIFVDASTHIRVSSGLINNKNVLLVNAETFMLEGYKNTILLRQERIEKTIQKWSREQGFDCLEIKYLNAKFLGIFENYLEQQKD